MNPDLRAFADELEESGDPRDHVTALLLRAVLGYQQWEADMLTDDEAWDRGERALPKMTQRLWDRLIEVQGQRVEALHAASELAKRMDL